MDLDQLGYNGITRSVEITQDGTINCKTINAINVNGARYSIGNIPEARELELRVQVLENLLKQKQNTDDKYKIVYGE